MAQHTPGPWTENTHWEIYAENGKHLAIVSWQFPDVKEGIANANLIAAAPDLLEVAETMVTYERSLPPKFVDMAREAIAKAKGE